MRPAQAIPGRLVDEALLATAPPPPVPAASGIAELEPTPPSVADLLEDSLDDACAPESCIEDEPRTSTMPWVSDEPLQALDGDEPTARLGGRGKLASLAYLEDVGLEDVSL